MGCETCEDISCQMLEMKAMVEEMSARFKRQEDCIQRVCRLLEEFLPSGDSRTSSIFPQPLNNNYLSRDSVPVRNGIPSILNGGAKSRSRKQHAPKRASDLMDAETDDCVKSTGSGNQCSTSGAESDSEINVTGSPLNKDSPPLALVSVKEENGHHHEPETDRGQSGDSGLGMLEMAATLEATQNQSSAAPSSQCNTVTDQAVSSLLNGMPSLASNHQTLIRFLSDQAAQQQSLLPHPQGLGMFGAAASQEQLMQAMLHGGYPESLLGPSSIFDKVQSTPPSTQPGSDFDTVVQYDSPTERRSRRPATAGRGGGEKGNFNCELCSSQFMWRGTWKRHMDTVHSKTRYRCTKCGFTSSRKDYLYVHIRTGACSKRKPKPPTPVQPALVL